MTVMKKKFLCQLGFFIPLFFLLPITPCLAAASSASSYESALQYYQLQQWRSAEIELRNSLQQDPSYLPARLLLGRLFIRSERWVEAEKELSIALQGGVAPENVIFDLMRAYVGLEDHHKVAQLLELHTNFSAQVEYQLMQANFASLTQDYLAASQLYEMVVKIAAGELADEAKVKFAELALRRSQHSKVIELTDFISANSRFFRQSRLLQAAAHTSQNRFIEAIQDYQQLLQQDPQDQLALLGKARALKLNGQIQQAIEITLQYREKFPDEPYGLLVYAALVGAEGQAAEQSRLLRYVQLKLSSLPESEQQKEHVLLLAATIDYSNQQYQSAILKLRRALKITSKNYQIYQLLAQSYFQVNDLDQAEQSVKNALQLNSAEPKLHLLAAAILNEKQDFSAERELLRQAYQNFSADTDIRQAYVQSLLANGQRDEAMKILVSQSSTQDVADGILMGYLQLEIGDIALARETAANLLKIEQSKIEVFQFAGDVAAKSNEIELARQFFQQALLLDSSYQPALLSLASLSLQRQDWQEASRYYQILLNNNPKDPLVLQLYADAALRLEQVDDAINFLSKLDRANDAVQPARRSLLHLYLQTGQLQLAKTLLNQLKHDGQLHADVYFAQAQIANFENNKSELSKSTEVLFGLWFEQSDRLYQLADFQLKSLDLDGLEKTLNRLSALDNNQRAIDLFQSKLAIERQQYELAHNLLKNLEQQFGQQLEFDELQAHLHLRKGDLSAAALKFAELFKKSKDRRHLMLTIRALPQDSTTIKPLLQQWLLENSNDIEITLMLADHLTLLGDTAQLIQLYEQSPLLHNHPVIQNNLAVLLIATNPERALRLAQQAYTNLPEQAEILDTYGYALIKTGAVEKGLGILRDAESRLPQSLLIKMHIAVALDLLGRTQASSELVEYIAGQKLTEDERKQFETLFGRAG